MRRKPATYPSYIIERLGHIFENNRPTSNPIKIVYGNGGQESIERVVSQGGYDILITPDHCGECLISGDQLTSTGHIITLTHNETIISDVLHRYELRYPRDPRRRDYPVPLDLLHKIGDLRLSHPINEQVTEVMTRPYQRYQPPEPATPIQARSGRLSHFDKSTMGKVLRLHRRMGHAPEDVMCMAIDQIAMENHSGGTLESPQKKFTQPSA